MYKVLIADDETLARKNMQEVIEKLGIFDIDMATNGAEAVMLLRTRPYDVVLLDIMMPQCNGIEVLKLINDIKPAPIKIIISGYDLFEYAQQAMQYGVSQYLVKPVAPEQIEELMMLVIEMLEQRDQLLESEKKVEEDLRKSYAIMKERFLERLTCSKVSRSVLGEQMDYYEVKFRWPLFSVALLAVENDFTHYDEKQQMTNELTLLNRLQGYSGEEMDVYAFHTMGDRIGVLFNYKSKLNMQEIENVLDELTLLFKTYFNVQLVGGVGNSRNSLDAVYQSFQESLLAFRWCIVSKSMTVKFYSDIFGKNVDADEDLDVNTLVAELVTGDPENLLNMVRDRFSNKRRQDMVSVSSILRIVSACQLACQSRNIEIDRDLLSQVTAVMCMDYSKVQTSAPEVLERLIQSTCSQITRQNEEIGGGYIRKAKQIVEKKVMEGVPDISVNMLANELGLSRNYFGKLFKSRTGMSLSNYVNNLRIKRATELLRTTNMKVYEVALAVGYENQSYFSIAFKENIGIPPSEFRDLI